MRCVAVLYRFSCSKVSRDSGDGDCGFVDYAEGWFHWGMCIGWVNWVRWVGGLAEDPEMAGRKAVGTVTALELRRQGEN
jgi:hypothetical protein